MSDQRHNRIWTLTPLLWVLAVLIARSPDPIFWALFGVSACLYVAAMLLAWRDR